MKEAYETLKMEVIAFDEEIYTIDTISGSGTPAGQSALYP